MTITTDQSARAALPKDMAHPAATLLPEMGLLVACARSVIGAGQAGAVRTLAAQPLDWQALDQLARRHHVTPLVFHCLKQHASDVVPAAVLQHLQQQHLRDVQRNLLHTSELVRILALFDQHHIAAVPLKGPLLAEHAYGNLGLRLFNDLDILIQRCDLWTAADLLLASDYRPFFDHSQTAAVAYVYHHNDYPLVHPVHGVCVELQWEIITAPFHFPPVVEQWWQRTEQHTLAGTSVQTLSAEDHLLMLCVHGCKHFWERLSWVCDVAAFLYPAPALDWQVVVQRATSTGVRRMLLIGLTLAHDMLGAPLPGTIERMLRGDALAQELACRAWATLACGDDWSFASDPTAPAIYMHMRERLRDRLAMLPYFAPGLRNPVQLVRRYRSYIVKALVGR